MDGMIRADVFVRPARLATGALVLALAAQACVDAGNGAGSDASAIDSGPATRAPSPASPESPAPARWWIVATDGADIVLLENGRGAVLLVDRVDEPEARFVAVSVRPGSTPDDLTVAVLEEEDGMFALRSFRWAGGEPVDAAPFPEPYQIGDTRTDGVVPQPVWAPDGGHLAWLEGGGAGPFSLRAIQWTGGPGSKDDRNDDAGWQVDVELSRGARLQEWTWLVDDGTTARGQWVITDPRSGGAPDGTSLVAYPVERQGDGALALPDPNAPYLQPDGGQSYIDLANGHAVVGEGDVRYFLRAPFAEGDGEGAVGAPTITAVQASDQGEALPVPEGLGRTDDPASIWMAAGGDAVLVGSDGRAWIVRRDGGVAELDGTIRHADFVRE